MNDNKLYFKGYPSGNLLKIVCKVLEYWINSGFFPILFYKIEGLSVKLIFTKDQTQNMIDLLNTQTQSVVLIYNNIRENSNDLIKL